MTYRNRKILDEAQHHPCQSCSRDTGTTVAAHSNHGRHGKGMGHKAADVFVAYLCSDCHSFVDTSSAPRAAREALWEQAHAASVPLFWHLLDDAGRGAFWAGEA